MLTDAEWRDVAARRGRPTVGLLGGGIGAFEDA